MTNSYKDCTLCYLKTVLSRPWHLHMVSTLRSQLATRQERTFACDVSKAEDLSVNAIADGPDEEPGIIMSGARKRD